MPGLHAPGRWPGARGGPQHSASQRRPGALMLTQRSPRAASGKPSRSAAQNRGVRGRLLLGSAAAAPGDPGVGPAYLLSHGCEPVRQKEGQPARRSGDGGSGRGAPASPAPKEAQVSSSVRLTSRDRGKDRLAGGVRPPRGARGARPPPAARRLLAARLLACSPGGRVTTMWPAAHTTPSPAHMPACRPHTGRSALGCP